MQYADYVNDYNALIARFYIYDPKTAVLRDENGIYDGGLTAVPINGGMRIGDWEYGYQASWGDFDYVDGAVFRDILCGYKMHFDGDAMVIYHDEIPEYVDDYIDIFDNISKKEDFEYY